MSYFIVDQFMIMELTVLRKENNQLKENNQYLQQQLEQIQQCNKNLKQIIMMYETSLSRKVDTIEKDEQFKQDHPHIHTILSLIFPKRY